MPRYNPDELPDDADELRAHDKEARRRHRWDLESDGLPEGDDEDEEDEA